MQCISVDLPDPDGPMIAVNSAGLEVEGHPGQGVHGGVARTVGLAQVRRRVRPERPGRCEVAGHGDSLPEAADGRHPVSP